MDELNDFLKANPNAQKAFDALIAGKDTEKEAAIAAKAAEKDIEKEAAVAAKAAEKDIEKEAAVAEIRYRLWLDERKALLNSRLSCSWTYRGRTRW